MGNQAYLVAMAVAMMVISSFPAPAMGFFNVTPIGFDEGYTPLFGDGNLVRSEDGRSVNLVLNRYSGSGFISSDSYRYGLFSASVKLPFDYTAGVVVAFYMSNGDAFEKTHDELDFEFLGNVRGQEWKVQTNVYGNGSTSRGREERYLLPFDPTSESHQYSILWTPENIIFYIDETPIREVTPSETMGGDYPSKPMLLYATIWDGSAWATAGGRYKVNYKYSPFVAEFSELILHGCQMPILQQFSANSLDDDNEDGQHCAELESSLLVADYAVMTPEKRQAMRKFREHYMTYSYCYDVLRYPVAFPDCDIVPSEQRRFLESGNIKYTPRKHRKSKRRDPSFENLDVVDKEADL
ncbi:LOW QUALITY PROTEIN: probable xyloglucan endotransglucosylase/hydrolase protein 30 [Dioscorea cayenensis subsp. rotundata]|uniref:Xyloglucan endotransglucosylase/hydrolase n=1 Tax=Dioscorea cayennensis subsp. rotundata TaxID=55577 RepID=A0AB40CNQ9_DIOCR|nr:LOW QUALITY PROTEIN: probable xyloglucan endotransglucosylase/hydrolase protein 30 [Dioscorea cayenensis subsp. rotundata]